jgi:hypothetical protein
MHTPVASVCHCCGAVGCVLGDGDGFDGGPSVVMADMLPAASCCIYRCYIGKSSQAPLPLLTGL